LDRAKPVTIYRRNLPHWRQEGATYFVTFRLADSIPRSVILEWKDADRRWLEANGVNGPLSDPKWREAYVRLPEKRRREFEREAGRRLHVELDKCMGSCALGNPRIAKAVDAAMVHFHGVRLWLGDVAIMPNHVHGLIQPMPGERLETLLGSAKQYVSRRVAKKAGSFWQQENYDRIVRDRRELGIWRKYIRDNPKKLRGNEGCLYRRADWLDEAAPL